MLICIQLFPALSCLAIFFGEKNILNIKFTVNNIFTINDQKRADKWLQIINQTTGQIKGYLALWVIIKSRIGLLSSKKNNDRTGIHFCPDCKNWFYNKKRSNLLCPNCVKVNRIIKMIIQKEKNFLANYSGNLKKLKRKLKERELREQLWIKCNGNKKEYKRQLFNHNMKKRYQRNKGNLSYRLNLRMSRLIYYSLKKNKAGKHWEDLVDFTLNELKEHLEKTMPEGYTWKDLQNGNKLHIDHIIPQRAFVFDSYKDKEFKMCWNLCNLRLLSKARNINKNRYFDNPILLYLLIKCAKKDEKSSIYIKK